MLLSGGKVTHVTADETERCYDDCEIHSEKVVSCVEAENKCTKKEQILWYLERIVGHLSDDQARTVLAMLEKFWKQRKDA